MSPFPPAPTLRTERLILRPLARSDVDAVFGYASQPGFFTYLDHVPLRVRQQYRMQDAVDHIDQLLELARKGFPNWAIVPTELGVPIGAVRFHPAPDAPVPELGYGLGPKWWGQGYATEACRAVMAWALGQVPVVVARTSSRNEASRRVLVKSGFRATGQDPKGRLTFECR